MLSNELIGNITITRQSLGVTRTQFSTVLFLGNTKDNTQEIKEYTSLQSILSDGFNKDSAEYKAAAVMFLQRPSVSKIIIAQKYGNGEDWDDVYMRYQISGKYAYCVILTTLDTVDNIKIQDLATTIGANDQIFAVNIKPDNLALAISLKEDGYNRVISILQDANNPFANAAIMGRILPIDPGTATLSNLEVTGISPASLNRVLQASYEENRVTYYDYITNLIARISPNTGKMSNGDSFEIRYGEDWIVTSIRENLLNIFLTRLRIPYNLEGFTLVSQAIKLALLEAQRRKIIENVTDEDVVMPDINLISEQDKIAGILNGISFSYKLTGYIKKIGNIDGSVFN